MAELRGGALTPGVAADDGAMMTRTVAITVSVAAAYLLLVAGLMAWCRYRRLRRKQQYLRTSAEGTSVLRELGMNGVGGGGSMVLVWFICCTCFVTSQLVIPVQSLNT